MDIFNSKNTTPKPVTHSSLSVLYLLMHHRIYELIKIAEDIKGGNKC